MPPSLAAVLEGIAYQDRFFWLYAPRLLIDESPVSRIEFEADTTGFDDLWLFYDNPIQSAGRSISAQYFQCKWHVRGDGSLGYRSLADPSFINTKNNSILTYARKYRDEMETPASQSEYVFVTPWVIHPDDPLATLYLNNTNGLDLKKLGNVDAPRRIREVGELWKQTLGLTSTAHLLELLEPIRLWAGNLNSRLINDALSAQLTNCGMVPINESSDADMYTALYQSLMRQGRLKFNKDSFRSFCETNNLLEECGAKRTHQKTSIQKTVGIRSFLRLAANIEDETDDYLCLLHYFQRRHINNPMEWNSSVLPAVQNFVSTYANDTTPLRLLLETHSSIAFACGSAIGSKPGCPVAICQRTRGSMIDWHANSDVGPANDLMSVLHSDVAESSDIVVCLSITHEIVPDVRRYLRSTDMHSPTIMEFSLNDGSGQSAVRDASHAIAIAERITSQVRCVNSGEIRSTVHLFSACPNALLFFLGQQTQALGTVQLYEFDFEYEAGGTYSPSLKIG